MKILKQKERKKERYKKTPKTKKQQIYRYLQFLVLEKTLLQNNEICHNPKL